MARARPRSRVALKLRRVVRPSADGSAVLLRGRPMFHSPRDVGISQRYGASRRPLPAVCSRRAPRISGRKRSLLIRPEFCSTDNTACPLDRSSLLRPAKAKRSLRPLPGVRQPKWRSWRPKFCGSKPLLRPSRPGPLSRYGQQPQWRRRAKQRTTRSRPRVSSRE